MVFSASGGVTTLPVVTLQPSSITDLNLTDLLKNTGGAFDSGSIQVSYTGGSMGVTCQVGIFSAEKRISFESREADMMDFMSSNLNGIVSLPASDAKGFLALTNVAQATVTVNLTIGPKKKAIVLSPRETILLNLNEELNERPPLTTLVQLQHIGKPGDVITTGFVLDLENGYSSAFTMSDPSIMQSSKLAGAHFRAGRPDPSEGFPEGTTFRSPLLLANVGSKPVTANVSVGYTAQEKIQMTPLNPQSSDMEKHNSVVKVKDLTLPPGEVRRVELSDAIGDANLVEDAGVDITYEGAPGSVIGQLTSVDQSGDYSFEVPIKDPLGMDHTASSSYPWTLVGGTDTTLHLKNTTDKSVLAMMQFRFPGGGIYNPDRIELQPYETVALDIQKLKDSKKLDTRQHTFPADATHGQVEWVEETPNSMIGRAEQVQPDHGIARSFSCGACSCGNYASSAGMNPTSFSSYTGWFGVPFYPYWYYRNCYGQQYGPYSSPGNYGVGFTSSNTAAVTVSGVGGQLSMVGPGTSTIQATLNISSSYYDNIILRCKYYTTQLFPTAPVSVNPPTHVHIIFDNNGFLSRCPVGVNVMGRNISMQVQDVTLHAVPNAPVQEHFAVVPVNTCGGQPPAQAFCQASDANGTFNDEQSVNTCAPPFHGCGWNLTDEWQWCPAGVAPTNLANMSPEYTHDNQLQMIGLVSPDPIGTANFRHIAGDIFP
jgi:hypothetical protein